MRRATVFLLVLACAAPSFGSSIKHRHPSLRALDHLDVIVLVGVPGGAAPDPFHRKLYEIVRQSLDGRGVDVGPYNRALWSDRAHLRVVAESRAIAGCSAAMRVRVLLEYVEEVFVRPNKVPLPDLVATWRWWDDVEVPESSVETIVRERVGKASGFFAADVSYAKEKAN